MTGEALSTRKVTEKRGEVIEVPKRVLEDVLARLKRIEDQLKTL